MEFNEGGGGASTCKYKHGGGGELRWVGSERELQLEQGR